MGDQVQRELELMIPELQHLAENDIFDADELRQVVRSRTNHEHSIRASRPNLTAHLRYIEHELALEKLRKLRVSRIRKGKSRGPSDHSITRRVSTLYLRAIRKWPGNIELALQYVNFCSTNGIGNAKGRAVTRLVQLHPRDVRAWQAAANWHLQCNKDLTAVRATMFKAVRTNPRSREMWKLFMEMEMECVRELYRGADRPDTANQASDGSARRTLPGSFVKLAESEDEDSDSSDDENTNRSTKMTATPKNPHSMEISHVARTIYDYATKRFPEDLDLRLQLYGVVEPNEHVADVKDMVMKDLSTRWPSSPDVVLIPIIRSHARLQSDREGFPQYLVDTIAAFRQWHDRHRGDESAKAVSERFCELLLSIPLEGDEGEALAEYVGSVVEEIKGKI